MGLSRGYEDYVGDINDNHVVDNMVTNAENGGRQTYGYKNLEATARLLENEPIRRVDGLRVLFVTGGFRGPTKFGGIGAAFYREANLFRSLGANVTVLYTAQGLDIEPWVGYFAKENITFVPMKVFKPNPYGTVWMVRSFSVYLWLKPREKQFDIIMFHDLYGMSLYPLYAKRAGVAFQNTPLIIHGHGATKLSHHFNARAARNHNTLVTYFMEKKAIEIADYVTVPSNFYADWMLYSKYKLSTQRTLTMQNLVEKKPMKQFNEPGTIIQSRHFCFFSRLDSLKGVFFMAETLILMASEQMELPEMFTFIGDPIKIGNKMSDGLLNRQLNGIGLNFRIISNFDTNQALSYMHEQKCILIIPSFGEAGPLVLYESVKQGLPVLYTDIQAVTDQLHDKLPKGLRFNPGDTTRLSKVIELAMRTGVPVQEVIIGPIRSKELYTKMLMYILNNPNPFPTPENHIPRYAGTVIITSHNRADTLKDLLLALLQQTFRHFKVLVIDCSTNDEAMELINEMGPIFEDSSIHFNFIQMEPAYVAQVRNVGMKNIDTTYGLFIDDDDIPTVNMVELFLRTAVRTNADTVTGFAVNFQGVQANNETVKYYSLSVGQSLQVELFFHYAGKSNMLVRKEAYMKVGGCTVVPDGSESPYVDWDLYVKLMLHGYTIEVVPEPTFQYRMHSKNSIYYQSIGNSRQIYNGHFKMIQHVCSFYKMEPEVCDAINYAKFALSRPRIQDFGD